MTPIKRPLAAAGAAVLLALSLSACGGAPTDASEKEFCETASSTDSGEEIAKASQDEDWDKVADIYHDQADELNDVGTPDGISDDEREGFEIIVDALKNIDGDDLKKADGGEDPLEDEYSKDDEKKVEAFFTYVSKTCADAGSSDDSDSDEGSDGADTDESDGGTDPGVGGTDLPTDIPTDGLPSDFPTDPEELESYLKDLEDLQSSLPTQ